MEGDNVVKINIKNLEFTIDKVNNYFELECPKLEIFEFAPYPEDAVAKMFDTLLWLWEEFVLNEDDKGLTADAIEFKNAIENSISVEK